jgi:ferric-dicitrate binding protein FerR (iron transport regulator)
VLERREPAPARQRDRHRALDRPLRRLRSDLPRELTEEIDACLDPRPRHRPSLEELGTAIEESLDHLADHPGSGSRHVGLRLGAIAAAAALGAVLVLGHGLALP